MNTPAGTDYTRTPESARLPGGDSISPGDHVSWPVARNATRTGVVTWIPLHRRYVMVRHDTPEPGGPSETGIGVQYLTRLSAPAPTTTGEPAS